MLSRRKRIPLEPEGIHSRRPNTSRRTKERHWLNRRMFLAKGAVAAGFVALGGRLAQLQLLEKDDYQEQASDYTTKPVVTKAPRGLIFDRAGRPIAENKRTWKVMVTPALLPDADEDPQGLARVKDTLVSALNLNQVLIVDPESVPIGSEATVYARIGIMLGIDKIDTEEVQKAWIDQLTRSAEINYVVLCESDLTPDQAAGFRAASKELPGVSVVSHLDYLLLNSWSGLETPIVVAKDVPKHIAMKLEASRVVLPGVSIDGDALARAYPTGPLAAHLLGYVSLVVQDDIESEDNRNDAGKPIYDPEDFIGVAGLEYTQEKPLRGTKGFKTVEVDANGVEQRTLSVDQEPIPGKDLYLTIDLELQSVLRQAITDLAEYSKEDRTMKNRDENKKEVKYDTGAGAAVMLDVRNGEVLAMVSMPDYDNQLFIENISVRKYQELDSDEAKRPLVNRAVANFYAPGSTIKPFIAAAGLREKVIDESKTFTCTGSFSVPLTENELEGQSYYCWNREGHNALDVTTAIEQSCDIFFYNTGTSGTIPEGATEPLHYYDFAPNTETRTDKHYFEGMGIARIHENLTKRFWFGQYTGIDLPTEIPGLVPDDQWLFDTKQEYWSPGDTIITSIGQGDFQATPIQMALNTAALANNGTLYRPLLIKKMVASDGKEENTKIEKIREIKINKNHLSLVRNAMWGVINDQEHGSAYQNVNSVTGETSTKWPLSNPEGEDKIEFAGKTGTAEFGVPDPVTRVYSHQHSWFIAYAPADNPEIAVSVVLEDGGEGSSYAVPIVDRAIRAYYEITGKRERGLILRPDKQPITEEFPAPNPDALKLVPGALRAGGDR